MSSATKYLDLIQAGLALTAAIYHLVARYKGVLTKRPWHIFIAFLSFVYFLGYLWLFSGVDVATWSPIMRGVGILSWPGFWIYTAVQSIREHDEMMRLECKLREYDEDE